MTALDETVSSTLIPIPGSISMLKWHKSKIVNIKIDSVPEKSLGQCVEPPAKRTTVDYLRERWIDRKSALSWIH